MLLQVGKTYLTCNGLSVEIISQHEISGPFAMLGKMVEGGMLLYYNPSGRHGDNEMLTDLIREAGKNLPRSHARGRDDTGVYEDDYTTRAETDASVEYVPIPGKPRSMMAMLDQITQSNEDQARCPSN